MLRLTALGQRSLQALTRAPSVGQSSVQANKLLDTILHQQGYQGIHTLSTILNRRTGRYADSQGGVFDGKSTSTLGESEPQAYLRTHGFQTSSPLLDHRVPLSAAPRVSSTTGSPRNPPSSIKQQTPHGKKQPARKKSAKKAPKRGKAATNAEATVTEAAPAATPAAAPATASVDDVKAAEEKAVGPAVQLMYPFGKKPPVSYLNMPIHFVQNFNWETMKAKIKHEIEHYWLGFRLLGKDVRIGTRLIRKALREGPLTRRERRQLIRTSTDVLRMVPMLFFILIPFAEFALPVVLWWYPGFLPSQFRSEHEREQNIQREIRGRIEIAKFLQDTLKARSSKIGAEELEDGPDGVVTKKQLLTFIERARNEEDITVDEVVKYASVFENTMALESLDRTNLVAMSALLGLNTMAPDVMLRYRLTSTLRRLREDDEQIKKEGGVKELSKAELQQACAARGMAVLGESKAALRRQLSQWLDLSLEKEVPLLLLILSRALMLNASEPLSDKTVAETIASLPDEVIRELEVPEDVDLPRLNKIKLEALEREEYKIEEEKLHKELIDKELEKSLETELDTGAATAAAGVAEGVVVAAGVVEAAKTPTATDAGPTDVKSTPKRKTKKTAEMQAKLDELIKDANELSPKDQSKLDLQLWEAIAEIIYVMSKETALGQERQYTHRLVEDLRAFSAAKEAQASDKEAAKKAADEEAAAASAAGTSAGTTPESTPEKEAVMEDTAQVLEDSTTSTSTTTTAKEAAPDTTATTSDPADASTTTTTTTTASASDSGDTSTTPVSETPTETAPVDEGSEGPKKEAEASKEKGGKANKNIDRLATKLTNTLQSLEERINQADITIGDKLNLLDKDKDGVISRAEFEFALLRLKTELDSDAIERIIDVLDSDRDGLVSLEEVEAKVKKVQEAKAEHEENIAGDDEYDGEYGEEVVSTEEVAAAEAALDEIVASDNTAAPKPKKKKKKKAKKAAPKDTASKGVEPASDGNVEAASAAAQGDANATVIAAKSDAAARKAQSEGDRKARAEDPTVVTDPKQ